MTNGSFPLLAETEVFSVIKIYKASIALRFSHLKWYHCLAICKFSPFRLSKDLLSLMLRNGRTQTVKV